MKKDIIDRRMESDFSLQTNTDETDNYNFDKQIKNENNLRTIHLSGERFLIREEAPVNSFQTYRPMYSPELPGVYYKGIQYYDLKNIYFINNTGLANLIDLLKSLLEKNVEVQFVNVSDKIKEKIRSLGLDEILICS